ncbi:ATP-binding protein [Puia sp. P3]|uniref:ATP-binding protein n=1 Tax=Puia sp. P3 TaxID=3423952 RepID=UPI003D6796AB
METVIFFCLLIYKFARPDDKTAVLDLWLIFLLLVYNISGGLLPDPNLPGSVFIQEIIAYGTGFITPSYFPYYVYKGFGLKKMRFHAFRGVYICLVFPYVLFVIAYGVSGKMSIAQNLLILPVLYAVWVINSLVGALKYKYSGNFSTSESKEELIGLLLSLTPWVGLPVIVYFDLGQVIEASVTNTGFLLLLSLHLKNHISLFRKEHQRLIQSETQLRNWNSTLQEEVERRTHELIKITEQRTNTLVNLAHETKTPLTLIDNYLEEYIAKNGNEEELSIVKRSLWKITTDISNIFDLERLNRGMFLFNHNQVTNFSEVTNDCLALFGPYCQKIGISLHSSVQKDILIKADPVAISRILTNLVENAIKFSVNGGTVEVLLENDGNKIRLSIKDLGIGIPLEMHKKVFEPYFQLNSPKASTQGMGLGLPMVKKIVQELNGEISLNSDPRRERGTLIAVSFRHHPLSIKDKLSAVSFQGGKIRDIGIEKLNLKKIVHDERKKTILVVEDNVSMVNYLQRKLSDKYNVTVALNGNDALHIVRVPGSPFDLIISDIMMDKLDGLNLARVISEDADLAHIPFLFLSAKTTAAEKLQGLKLGAIGFIPKPFSIQELMQQVDSIITHSEKQRKAILSKAIDHLSIMNGHSENKPTNGTDYFEANCKLYKLTAREKAIAKLVCEGYKYKEIGEKLFIAERTVTKHVQNIFEKVDVSNKIELINKLAG